MKRLFAILLALIMLLSLAACGEPEETKASTTGNKQPPANPTTQKKDDPEPPSGNLTQAQMEAEILRRLSAISPLSSLTLCGGDSITYTTDGFIMAGDWWTIENPNMGKDDFMASIDAQLTAAGFTADYGLLGRDYTVKAGPGTIGINIYYDSDGNELTLRTTNHRDEYSQAFIDAENAKLPTIIEGIDLIEKLPENFSISFTTRTYKYTVCRYNGSYYVAHESLDQADSDLLFYSYDVALLQSDGSYHYYDWYDTYNTVTDTRKEGKPQKTDAFMSQTSNSVDVQINKILEPLSLWLRMSWDYKGLPVDGDRFFWDKASPEYAINENLIRVGAEAFLGRDCEKVHSEGLWADTYDIIFDLETGMILQMTVQENGNGEAEIHAEVTAYDTNPTSLGNFVQP